MMNCVTMRTTVAPKWVHYAVLNEQEATVWETYVPFGGKATNNAGGFAFRLAAKQQEWAAQRVPASPAKEGR